MSRSRLIARFSFVLVLCFCNHSWANSDCSLLLADSSQVRKSLSQSYPSLSVVLSDPQVFWEKMQTRYQERKVKHPSDPLNFDYSEVGIPVIQDMLKHIPTKVRQLENLLQRKDELAGLNSKYKWLNTTLSSHYTEENIVLAILYLKELERELFSYIEDGRVGYLQVLEVSYFYSRIIGVFSEEKISIKDRLLLIVERQLQGYVEFDVEKEYRDYKERKFRLFDKKSKNGPTQVSMELMEERFNSEDSLNMIFVPTHLELKQDIFYALLSHPIYILGVTLDPIAADGFLRPAGLFWSHDVGHSALIYRRHQEFFAEIMLSDEKLDQLRTQMLDWYAEIEVDIQKIRDPNLRYVVSRVFFSIHHERGYPLVPSTYLKFKRAHFSTYLLFATMIVSGHGPDLGGSPLKNVQAAYDWLKSWWLKKINIEKEILEN